jgi:hypothetical protein
MGDAVVYGTEERVLRFKDWKLCEVLDGFQEPRISVEYRKDISGTEKNKG